MVGEEVSKEASNSKLAKTVCTAGRPQRWMDGWMGHAELAGATRNARRRIQINPGAMYIREIMNVPPGSLPMCTVVGGRHW